MPSKNYQLRLTRLELDETLARFDPVFDLDPPPRGWIRAIRDAVGMTGRQLARRLGLTQQSVARMEKDEVAGALTLNTLRRVAAGLDCVLVYGIVPRESLDIMVHDRARALVGQREADADPSLVEDLVEAMPPEFWAAK